MSEAQAGSLIELARAHLRSGRLTEAELTCQLALQADPDGSEALHLLGRVLLSAARAALAIPFLEKAAKRSPETASIQRTLGAALLEANRHDEAEACCERAIRIAPANWKNHRALATVLIRRRRTGAAIEALRRAIELEPGSWVAAHDLGVAFVLHGEAEEAVIQFRRALELAPRQAEVRSALLYTLHYLHEVDGRAIHDESLEFGRTHGAGGEIEPFRNEPDPERRIRVGYVSGDLARHPVGQFLLPVLLNRDRERFEVFCYSNGQAVDDQTRRLYAATDTWRIIAGSSDLDAARTIREDGIDILVDLAGHTGNGRLTLFGLRPAPVQMTWMGYFGTSGLPQMDYFIGDPYVVPVEDEPNYVERVVRLPHDFLCLGEHPDVPVALPPCHENGFVTFGCFNQLVKINRTVIEVWARILAAVPGSRIVLKTGGLDDPMNRARYLELFAAVGVPPERVELAGATPHREYLAAYSGIDIGLDPFPFNGGTTTIDALWMGVPVVSLAGNRFASRMGVAHLTTVGVPELIAGSTEEYERIAVDLALDHARIAEYRRDLRGRVLASPLCDAHGYTRALEAIYRDAWRVWCEGATAQ